jgi:hypothetical protein
MGTIMEIPAAGVSGVQKGEGGSKPDGEKQNPDAGLANPSAQAADPKGESK